MLPKQINILPLQPIRHRLIHIREPLILRIRQILQDGMSQTMLRDGQILVPFRILGQLLLSKDIFRHTVSIDSHDFIFLIEQFGVLGLPLAVLDFGEEDEATVAFDVDGDALAADVRETLGDGGFHLADAALLGQIDVGERAVFAVHDEVAVGAAFDRDFDEVFDGETAGPGWWGLLVSDELRDRVKKGGRSGTTYWSIRRHRL